MPNPFVAAHNYALITATTAVVPVIAATSRGDAVVCSVMTTAAGVTASGVTDTQGNTYLPVVSFATNPNIFVFAATGPAVMPLGLSDTFTVSYSSASGSGSLIAVSCPGTGAVDVSNVANATSTAPSVTATTTAANDLALGLFAWGNGGGAGSAPSFTLLDQQHTGSTAFNTATYQARGAPGSVTASYTTTSAVWRAIVIALAPGVVAGQGIPTVRQLAAGSPAVSATRSSSASVAAAASGSPAMTPAGTGTSTVRPAT